MYRDNVVKDLLKLIQDNPTLPVKAKVDQYLCSGYDYAWYLGDIVEVTVEEYAIWSETLYTDRESLIDDWMNSNYYEFDENISNEELAEYAHTATDHLWKKAIFVTVEASEEND